MLGSVVYQVLAGYLGHYVKDMQREQFRIGLWSGEVLLENVDLRLEAFDSLQLPLSILQASIGKLKILVPWKKLGWEPILISLEDVTIRTGPQDDGEWDAEASERRELAAKKAALASAEIAKFSKCVSETKSGQSFLSNFFGKIIDNVQVAVRNVHIQYMDNKTDPEVMFLVGLTLSSLTVSTSDASFAGSTGGGKVRGSQEHKVVEVKQLAMYWNPQSHPLGASLEAKDNQIISVLKREEHTPGKVVYLLRPTDVTLKLLLNKNMTGEDGAAQYAVVINVDDLSLALEDLQLRGMLLLFDAVSIARAREKYGRFRPHASEGQDGASTEWEKRLWQYAIDAVLSDVRKTLWRRSLGYLVWRRAYRERYVDLYVDKLENLQRGQPSGEEESAELEEIERQFEMDEILFFRSLAERKLPLEDIFGNAAILEDESGVGAEGPTAEDLLAPEPVLQQKGWLNWLSLGLLGAADHPDVGQIFPQEIIKDLYEAAKLHPMPMLETGELAKGQCHLAITLHVGELLGSLHSSKLSQDILNVSVQGIAVTAQMWTERTTVSLMVRTLEAVDLCTPGTRFPRILAPWGKLAPQASQRKPARRSYAEALAGSGLVRSVSDGSMSTLQGNLASDEDGLTGEKSEPLVRVEVELEPKRSDHDLTVTVVLQPVEFVYSDTLIKRASSFFSFPTSQEVLNDQVDTALKKLEDVAVTNFKHKVVERKRLKLLLDIRRPNFLFPESSLTSNGILMILAVDSIILASQELRYALEDTSSKGLSRTAILRRHIGMKHGLSPIQGQSGRSQDAVDIPLDKCGHYDRFQLRLTGAQVLISGSSGDWHETLNTHEPDMEWHLVKRFNLQVAIGICIKEDPTIPRLKVHGSLPALRLHFSLGKCRAVSDLLSRLIDSGRLSKGALDTSASQRPHGAEEKSMFTWEMSLKLKVVTVELSLDSERPDAPTQMEKKTLVAQGQEMNIKCVQRSSHADLELLMKTVHVEDGSELASSPFRYLLYCAGCHRSMSPRPAIVDTKPILSTSTESSEENYAVCLKMVMGGPTCVPKMGIMAALHGLEFHINPKGFRALHGFALAAVTPRASASSGSSRSLTTISDGFPPDFRSLHDSYVDGGESGNRSVFSGLPIKSPGHDYMQALALSTTSSSIPSGSVPLSMNSQDGGIREGESEDDLHFFFEKLTRQLLSLSAMFQNQVARRDSVIIDIQLESCGVQFLDAGGTVAVVLLPDATVCTSVPSAASSSLEAWEIVAVSSDLQLKGTNWASGNINEDPVGSLSSGPTATWDVRVRMSENGNMDVVFQIRNAQVVLLADYLAGLIHYFDSSHWTSQSKMNMTRHDKGSTICWKVEVEDSVLLLPRAQGKDEFVKLVFGEFLFTAVEDHNPATSYYIVGQNVSVRLHGTDDDGDRRGTDFVKSSCGQTLVERWDGELLIDIPPGNNLTCVEIHSSALELILDGNVAGEQVEAFQHIVQDLSGIEWTLNTMALTTIHGGLASWIPGKHIHVQSSSTGTLKLKFCALKLRITFATLVSENRSILPVAVLQVDTVDADISLKQGVLEALGLEVLSIMLFCHAPRIKLLQCKGGEELGIQPGLKLVVNAASPQREVHISVPSIQVWLHIAAWSAVGPVVAASINQSKQKTVTFESGVVDAISGSSMPPPKVEILVLQEDLDYSSPPRQDTHPMYTRTALASSIIDIPVSRHQQSKNAAVLVKVGTFRLALLVLDSPIKAQEPGVVEDEDPALLQEILPGKRLSCSFSLRVDEFQYNKDGTWALAAGITQGEGNVVEIFEDQDAFQERCFQTSDICISIDGSFLPSPVMRFDLKLNADCINFWCSYPILRFFRQFTFEELDSGPPSRFDVEGKAEICLQHASILLSDGRWSCKAPIVELLLGNIIAQSSYNAQKLEASLSSALEANYHNMHKVSWEPLVEPWSVNFIWTLESATGASKSQDCTRVKVSSSAKLNINITESLVQAVSRAAEMAHDAWSDDSMATDTRLGNFSQYAPYWLQNDTGVALTYWLIESRHSRDDMDDVDGSLGGWGSGSGNIVEPGKSVPLYQQGSIEEILSRKRNSGLLRSAEPAKMFEVLLQHRMICVQIEGTSRPSPPLSIDLVGSRSFEASFSENESVDGYNPSLNSTPGNLPRQNSFQKLEMDNRDKSDVFRTSVVFEVTVQRYSKLVRLCSTVSVVNMISVPLEVRFDIPFTISPKVMEPVLPGQVMPLPVHLAQTGKIRWRPLGNKYVWSEVQSIRHLLQSSESLHGLHRFVLCYPNSRISRPFRCCLSVCHSPIVAVDSNYGELTQDPLEVGKVSMGRPKELKLWDITLQAPLVVKNCLPMPVVITIDSGTGTIVSHTAAKGDSKFVYDVDTVHNLSVTFRVRGFVTSSSTVMQAAQSITESSRRSDKEGRIRVVETVNFFPEIMSDPVVAAEVEFTINMTSGTREICISVPFWLYNCSPFDLAVVDGDVDAFSGRQKYLARVSTESSEKEKQQTDTKPGLASLQTSEQQGGEISFGWFPKRSARFISQAKVLSKSKLITAYAQESISSKGENLDEYWRLLIPHMYSPVKGTESSEHRLRARVVHPVHMETRNSIEQSWSRPFSVDIPDGTTTVTVPHPQKQGAYVLSVICNPVLGSGAGKSKTVTFRPRFLIANSCKRDLCVKQQGTDALERLPVGQHCHLHWTDMTRALLVSVRFSDHGWDWSGGFAPDQLGDTQVKVRNHTSGATQMLRVEVSTMTPAETTSSKGVGPGSGNLGTCLILLSDDETGFMPYRIDNFSMERIRFHQQKCEKMENMLHPYSSFCYAWDEPCDPHRLVLEIPGGGPLGVYGLDEVKEYSPITLMSTSQDECTSQKPERTFTVSVRAEGPIRVLSIADTSLHLMKNISESSSNIPSNQLFSTPNSRILESIVTDTESVTELFVDFSYIGMSLIDSVPQEIIFACAKGFSLQLVQGQHQQQVKLEVSVIQIDNQLRFAVYPVLLSSTYPHAKLDVVEGIARTGRELKPSEGASLALLIAKWRRPAGSVDCFQCISLRLVPMRLEVEEQVVSSLLGFVDKAMESFPGIKIDKAGASKVPAWSLLRWNRFNGQDQFAGRPWKFEVVQVSTIQSRDVRFMKVVKRLEEYQSWASVAAVEPVSGPHQRLPLLTKEKSKAYIEILDISPIELTVSFSSTPWLSNSSEAATKNSLLWMTGMMLQHHVMAIVDAEDAVMNLRRLTLAHPLASWDAIRGMITRHYTRQLLQEVYKVVGSADVLGNPIHFVRTLGSGMWDFVSTPAKSLNQSPRQLAWGLFQGTHSLFSNTIFAFSNAATRMSKVARKTVTAFAFDKEYVDRMERREHSHGMEDLSVVNEFLEGLTGLLQSPVRGAERAGLPGMLSGAAVGALGVVARPVATILEVASKTGQSIVNRSSPKQWRATRIRLPRHLREDSPLLPYSWESAVGRAVLLETDGGCFRNEVLMLCLPLAHGNEFVLLTQTRILKVSSVKVDYFSGFKWHMELVAAVEDILHIDHVENRVNILLGPARREFVRTQHYSGLGHKVMSLPAHETFTFVDENALEQFLGVLHFLEDRLQHSRATILISTRTL